MKGSIRLFIGMTLLIIAGSSTDTGNLTASILLALVGGIAIGSVIASNRSTV